MKGREDKVEEGMKLDVNLKCIEWKFLITGCQLV